MAAILAGERRPAGALQATRQAALAPLADPYGNCIGAVCSHGKLSGLDVAYGRLSPAAPNRAAKSLTHRKRRNPSAFLVFAGPSVLRSPSNWRSANDYPATHEHGHPHSRNGERRVPIFVV